MLVLNDMGRKIFDVAFPKDLLLAQALGYFGAIKRGNVRPLPQPYKDQQGRVFIADGLRYVLGLGSEPTALPDVEIMQWERLSWR